MPALGQKQTCAVQNGMSALHPIATAKADISWGFSEASACGGVRRHIDDRMDNASDELAHLSGRFV